MARLPAASCTGSTLRWARTAAPVEAHYGADHEPWERAFDDRETPFYRWFSGGLTNACFNGGDRHVLAGCGAEPALFFEGDRWDQSLDGFSDKTLSDRTHNAGARIVITVDDGFRNAQIVPLREADTDPALDAYVLAEVDVSELGDKAARINITMPQRILRAGYAYARKQGETRSGSIARAASNTMRKPA